MKRWRRKGVDTGGRKPDNEGIFLPGRTVFQSPAPEQNPLPKLMKPSARNSLKHPAEDYQSQSSHTTSSEILQESPRTSATDDNDDPDIRWAIKLSLAEAKRGAPIQEPFSKPIPSPSVNSLPERRSSACSEDSLIRKAKQVSLAEYQSTATKDPTIPLLSSSHSANLSTAERHSRPSTASSDDSEMRLAKELSMADYNSSETYEMNFVKGDYPSAVREGLQDVSYSDLSLKGSVGAWTPPIPGSWPTIEAEANPVPQNNTNSFSEPELITDWHIREDSGIVTMEQIDSSPVAVRMASSDFSSSNHVDSDVITFPSPDPQPEAMPVPSTTNSSLPPVPSEPVDYFVPPGDVPDYKGPLKWNESDADESDTFHKIGNVSLPVNAPPSTVFSGPVSDGSPSTDRILAARNIDHITTSGPFRKGPNSVETIYSASKNFIPSTTFRPSSQYPFDDVSSGYPPSMPSAPFAHVSRPLGDISSVNSRSPPSTQLHLIPSTNFSAVIIDPFNTSFHTEKDLRLNSTADPGNFDFKIKRDSTALGLPDSSTPSHSSDSTLSDKTRSLSFVPPVAV